MQDLRHHTAQLTQDIPAVTIPDGGSLLLKEGERVTIQVGRDSFISPDATLFEEVERMLGKNRFVVNQMTGRR